MMIATQHGLKRPIAGADYCLGCAVLVGLAYATGELRSVEDRARMYEQVTP